MGLFKRKKERKKEEINIDFNDTILFDNFVEEQKDSNIEENTKENISLAQMEKDIISFFSNIIKKNERIIKEYYICKIFSRVGLKDLDFNLQVITMDKHVNRLKKDCFDLSRIIDNLKVGLKLEDAKLIKLHKQVIDLQAFQAGLLSQLTEINNGSYGHLKISTVTVTINKTNDELALLYENIAEELKKFKSFEEASEYIFYNSGEYIDNIVNCYIDYVKESNNEEYILSYNRNYFLPSDVVISLEIKEWIELYNKLKFVLKLMKNINSYSYAKCHELFNNFEAKYAILMMRVERKKK